MSERLATTWDKMHTKMASGRVLRDMGMVACGKSYISASSSLFYYDRNVTRATSIKDPNTSKTYDMFLARSTYLPRCSLGIPSKLSLNKERPTAKNLNGLLAGWTGTYSLFGNPDVRISILNDPDTLNKLQRSIGRNPGVDAFEIHRSEEVAGLIDNTTYLSHFAEGMRVPVSGLSDPVHASHDVDPGDHVGGWFSIPPEFCEQIADAAKKALGNPENEAHIATAIDRLQECTSHYLYCVNSATYESRLRNMPPPQTLEQVAEDGLPTFEALSARNLEVLTTLGIAPQDPTAEELAYVNKKFERFIANILLNARKESPVSQAA